MNNFENGSSVDPSLSFDSAQNTGLFLANVDTGSMGLASNGVSALEITSNALLPAGTETYDLGSDERRFGSLYLSANTLHLGNVVLKDEDGSLSTTAQLIGDGSGLSNLVAANINGLSDALDIIQASSVDANVANVDVVTANVANVDVVTANVANVDVVNAGSVNADFFVGDGSQLTGISQPMALTSVQLTDSSFVPVDDTTLTSNVGGYFLVNGSNFFPGSVAVVGGTNASATAYHSSTQLRVHAPAKASGSYTVSVIRSGDGSSASLLSAVTYSEGITWITGSQLGNVTEFVPFSIPIQAVSDSQVTYSNVSPLPPSTSLNPTTGQLTGTISGGDGTSYSFDIEATDLEYQDAIRSFLLQYNIMAYGKKIIPSDSQANALFGVAQISGDGTRVIVGAYAYDSLNAVNSGQAYIFRVENRTWVQETILKPPNPEVNGQFGSNCCIDQTGTYVVVYETGGDKSGSLHVFVRSGSAWVYQETFRHPSPAPDAYFGSSVCISSDGSRIVASSTRETTNQGAIYVFFRTVFSGWVQEARIVEPSPQDNIYFGYNPRISGDGSLIAVSSANRAEAVGQRAGAVYIFSRSGTTWDLQQKITPSDAAAYDYFGIGMDISRDGTRIIAGSAYDDAPYSDSGSVYIFSWNGANWVQERKITPSDPNADYKFGYSACISADGSRAVVYSEDETGGLQNSGAVYVFYRVGTSWYQETKIRAYDPEMDSYFGQNVGMSDDGLKIVCGALYDDAEGPVDFNGGAAYIICKVNGVWTQQQP